MQIEVCDSILRIGAAEWNPLAAGHPFLRHEFLAALERHGAVGRGVGWIPHHLVLRDDSGGRIAGALPAWLKLHSRGEFVFDFAWAHAFEHHGRSYYPKLVGAIPWTPATGPRLLVAPDRDRPTIANALADGLRQASDRLGLSGAHVLFARDDDIQALEAAGFLPRTDVHYFWTNAGYSDFDAFLSTFVSRKRKKMRRERRQVIEQGIELEVRHGNELTDDEWHTVHRFYALSFMRKTDLPTFSAAFFQEIGETMGEQLVIFLARCAGTPVAAAILFRDDDALYGRYWGSEAEYHSLHFEACYHQGIEYCIRHGLRRFEPGAQGEHKIARGFLPTRTRSAHWIGEPAFRDAIAEYLQRERMLVEARHAQLLSWSPFRSPAGEAV